MFERGSGALVFVKLVAANQAIWGMGVEGMRIYGRSL